MGAMSRVVENYKLKVATLDSCKESFTIKRYLKAKSDILATEEERKLRKVKSGEATPAKETKFVIDDSEVEGIASGALFGELKAWRIAKARELGAPTYTITRQSVLIAIASMQPTSKADLARIKGVGKAFIEKYGVETLVIVKRHSGEKDMFSA